MHEGRMSLCVNMKWDTKYSCGDLF